ARQATRNSSRSRSTCRRARSLSLSRRSCRARASSAGNAKESHRRAPGEDQPPPAHISTSSPIVATDASAHAPLRARRSLSSYLMPAAAGLLLTLLLVWLVVNLVQEPSYFVTISFIGLTNGAVYALVALGYTLG